MPELDELSLSKCRELLGAGVVGRVAVCTPQGPVVFPVNYSLVDETIILRTRTEGVLARHATSGPIAFEVDHVDYDYHRGWSVLARGPAHVVEDRAAVEHIERTWGPRPWASGERPVYLRLDWDELTGRRLGAGWTFADELPSRRQTGPTQAG